MTDVRLPDGTVATFPNDMSKEQVRALIASRFPDAAPKPGPVEDALKAAGSGLVTGTEKLVGLPGDFRQIMRPVADAVGGFVFGPGNAARGRAAMEQARQRMHLPDISPPTSDQVASAQRAVTGFEPYKPQTTAGQFANTAAEFVPSAVALGPGGGGLRAFMAGKAATGGGLRGMASNALKFGVAPGLTSEGAGQYARSAYPEAEGLARIAGALAGPMVAGGLRKAVTPTRSDPYAQQAAMVLERNGVETTAGQRTGSHALRFAEDEIGGPAAAAFYERQGEQFTRAVLRRAGIDAPRATPDVMDAAFTRLGNEFDQLAAGSATRIDPQATRELNRAFRAYTDMTPAAMRVPAVQTWHSALTHPSLQIVRGGVISGEQYQSVRSRLGALAREMAQNGSQGYQGASALRAFQEALDGALERSISDPRLRDRWRTVRQQYRDLLPIEEAMATGGEQTARGLIPPQQFRNIVARKRSRRSYVRGTGPYAELARAGAAVLKPMPQSGTAPRLAARGLLNQTPAAIGGALGYGASGGDWMVAALGGGAGALSQGLINAGARNAMFSPALRGYLANQVLPPPNYTPFAGIPATSLGGLLATRREGP